MRRRIALGVALCLFIAMPLAWSLYRRSELLALVDAPPALSFQVESARELYDRFLASQSFQILQTSGPYLAFWDSEQGRMLESVRRGLTVVLHDDPIHLLLQVIGRRARGALWIRPTGGQAIALIALPEEGTDVADLAKAIVALAKTNKRIEVKKVQGFLAVDLGGETLLFGNGVVTIASSTPMALRIAREWKIPLRKDPSGSGNLSFRINPNAARLTSVAGAADGFGGLLSRILVGAGSALSASHEVVGQLAPMPGGLRFEAHVDAGLRAMDELTRRLYAPATFAPGPAAPGEILRAQISCDFAQLWEQGRVAPEVLEDFGKIESLLQAPALFQSLFTGIEPGLTIVAAPQSFDDPDWPAPESPFPGLALTVRLKDPEQLGPRLTAAFASAVQLANERLAESRRSLLRLENLVESNGAKVVRARFDVPGAGERRIAETWRSFTPSIGRRDRVLALATSSSLVRDLLSHELPPPIENTARNTLHVDIRKAANALRAARTSLVQSEVERGEPLEKAESDIDMMLAILGTLDSLDAELAYGGDTTRLSIELHEKQPETHEAPSRERAADSQAAGSASLGPDTHTR
jgi:hypothetical protein